VHTSNFPWRVAIDRGVRFVLLSLDGTSVEASYRGASQERPVIGDDVAFDASSRRIVEIAPRRTWIARVRTTGESQLIAANLTAAFVVTSPEPREFSPRRVVRYLIALRAGGVEAVVVLNKCDIAGEEAAALVTSLREVADGAPVIPLSARTGENCDALDSFLYPRATVALCGSSGVGKSSLVNYLAGKNVAATNAMRDDGRGRHTTTVRRLILLENGAAIVDTPGMRLFMPSAQSEEVDRAFSDIVELASSCRFSDCRHAGEPGCAVIENGSSERVEQWRKLQREIEWAQTRESPLAAIDRKNRWKQLHKAARAQRRRTSNE
jgi:ribosome biogenesis GTPase